MTSAMPSSDSEEGLGETQRKAKRNTNRGAKKGGESSDRNSSRRSSSANEQTAEEDSEHGQETSLKRKEDGQVSNIAKKRRSDSGSSRNVTEEGDETGGQLEGARSDEDTSAGSQRGQEARAATKKKSVNKKVGGVLASGEVEAHMADKEFISNQVRIISTPFVLESGPRSWMQVWKAQQTSHDVELPDIPSSVIDRIVTKINFTMEELYQRRLGRQQQRTTLMSLDELRKQPREKTHISSLKTASRNQTSLQEIISSYPSEWPGRVEVGEEEMAERYSSLRARLFALSRSVSISKQQCDQYKSLVGVLKGIDTNLEKKCSSEDWEEEVKRSRDLVSKIKLKLLSGTLGARDDNNTEDDTKDTSNPIPPTNHTGLVRTLFKAAASAESS